MVSLRLQQSHGLSFFLCFSVSRVHPLSLFLYSNVPPPTHVYICHHNDHYYYDSLCTIRLGGEGSGHHPPRHKNGRSLVANLARRGYCEKKGGKVEFTIVQKVGGSTPRGGQNFQNLFLLVFFGFYMSNNLEIRCFRVFLYQKRNFSRILILAEWLR